MDPGQASGSRRAAGTPPSDERVRADPRQRVESPEGEAPPAPSVLGDGVVPPPAARPIAPPPAAQPIALVLAGAAGAAEVPPGVRPEQPAFGDDVEIESDDDDLAAAILPPEEDETDAAAEMVDSPPEAEAAAEAARDRVLAGKTKITAKDRKLAGEAADAARNAVRRRKIFDGLGEKLEKVGTGDGENAVPIELLRVFAEINRRFEALHPDGAAKISDRVSRESIADVLAHFMDVYDLRNNKVEAERRVDVAKKTVEDVFRAVLNDPTNAGRGWTKPARGSAVDLLDYPRFYTIFIAGYGPAVYEGQLPPKDEDRDANIAETPLVRRFIEDVIVSLLDELNHGVPVPDEIASMVTSAGADRHPFILNKDKAFTYNPTVPGAKMTQEEGSARSGSRQHPNLVKMPTGVGPQSVVRGGSGKSSEHALMRGWRDVSEYVHTTGKGEITHTRQQGSDGKPSSRASVVFPVTHHGVVGVDRTLIPAKVTMKNMGSFTNTTGRALRFFQNARLALPVFLFIVVLRLLPVQFGGVDGGIIAHSAATVAAATVDAIVSGASSAGASSRHFFPPEAEPTDRDKLLAGVIMHDVATTDHRAIRAASLLDNAPGAPVAYPLLRSYDDMGGLARRCVLAVVLLVMRKILRVVLRSPDKASLAWRSHALMRLEYATLAFLVVNLIGESDHWLDHLDQLRALLVALGVVPVVGSHIRNILKGRRAAGDVTPRRRELELATHALRTFQIFDPSCSWTVPGVTFPVYDATVTSLGDLYEREFGLGGVSPSRFPSAVDLAPDAIPAANHGARVAIDFDPPLTRVVLSIRVSDPRSLVDVKKRDKASAQQLLTAAMALRDTYASVGVRARIGEFVVHVATGSKSRHEDTHYVAFAPHPGGHLHRALLDLITGDDVHAARDNFQAGAAAAEAARHLANAERDLRDLPRDAAERGAAARNATDARSECVRATTASARAAARQRLAGPRYGVPWHLLHSEMYAGVTEPVIASESVPNASATFVSGRGYADFIAKVDDMFEKRRSAGVFSRSVVVLFAVAWLDRIPARAMEALRANSRLPVAAFSATETAAVFRKDPRTFACPITGCARLADVDVEPDGSAARYRDVQSRSTLAMRDFLESFASAASFGTVEWASLPVTTMLSARNAIDKLDATSQTVLASLIREMDAHAEGGGVEDEDSAARFAVAPDPDHLAMVPRREFDRPRRVIGFTRRSGISEKFRWQFKKISAFISAVAVMSGVTYDSATTFALECVSGRVPVDEVRRGVRVRHHDAQPRGDGEGPRPVRLFDGANVAELDDSRLRDKHAEWDVKEFEGAWIRRAIDDVNRRDAERAARERRAAPPPADVVFATVSRVCNPGTIKELARYVRRTGGRVFDCTIFRALVFDDVEGVDDERARLRAFLLNRDGSLKLDDPHVEGFLTFLSLQSVSWRYTQGVILPFWRER